MGALERIFHELLVFLLHLPERLLILFIHHGDSLVNEAHADFCQLLQVEIQPKRDFGVFMHLGGELAGERGRLRTLGAVASA